jgi:hypothetical protein
MDLFPRIGRLFEIGGPTPEMAFSPIGVPPPAQLHSIVANAKTREEVEDVMKRIPVCKTRKLACGVNLCVVWPDTLASVGVCFASVGAQLQSGLIVRFPFLPFRGAGQPDGF